MEINKILKSVKNVIHESTGIEQSEIELDKTLFDDLAIDSIDMVDILYELENEYEIKLELSELEKRSKSQLDGKPYEVNSVITEEGIQALKEHLPEVDQSKLVAGITIHELIKVFTVHSLCKLVKHQIDNSEV